MRSACVGVLVVMFFGVVAVCGGVFPVVFWQGWRFCQVLMKSCRQ